MIFRGKFNITSICFTLCFLLQIIAGQDFASYFKNCRVGTPKFDNCLRIALNDVRPFFKTGLPQYGVEPFDPFFVEIVTLKRSTPNINFYLALKNAEESGWTQSKITNLKSDLPNNKIQYTQVFPEKFVNGEFEIIGTIFGSKVNNTGIFNLSLYDYVQTTTVTRKPNAGVSGEFIYEAKMEYDTTRDMKLYLRNKNQRNPLLGNMINYMINSYWRIGIRFLSPYIDELVSSAFTEIFTKAFQRFPFAEIFS
ncbi:hypothetical protein FQA39_LY15379 [Lamprigera yunnana]|nr:hypothetical protein FQA39_LY15379 [Lamprigera yunnana]